MAHDKAHRHLAATDPRMAALIARSVRYNVKPGELVRPFDALAESIAYQQLSGKAAATIWKRVRALYPRRKYLDPRAVLATPDEKLRGAGLSRSKVAALKDLRSEEHTSELQSQSNLVCRLLLEKKKTKDSMRQHNN